MFHREISEPFARLDCFIGGPVGEGSMKAFMFVGGWETRGDRAGVDEQSSRSVCQTKNRSPFSGQLNQDPEKLFIDLK